LSFSAQTKNELARVVDHKPCCKMAELSSLFRMDGSIQISGSELSINIVNENAAVARKIFTLVREIFAVHSQVMVQKKSKLKKNNIYMVRIPPGETTREILVVLGLTDEKGLFLEKIRKDFLKKECCRRAYLRGTFLGGGSVNKPGATYHLEIITTKESYAREIKNLFKRFKLDAKVNLRKNWHVVYLKESEQIIASLSYMGAYEALLDFENKRILKGMKNQVNRLVNCETANLNKTVSAAVQQLESIRRIKDTIGLNRLTLPLRQIAEARINNPEASLRELGELFNPKISKSGVSHRLKRIEELAQGMVDQGNRDFKS
jgi:DNA-binding protein WhiA